MRALTEYISVNVLAITKHRRQNESADSDKNPTIPLRLQQRAVYRYHFLFLSFFSNSMFWSRFAACFRTIAELLKIGKLTSKPFSISFVNFLLILLVGSVIRFSKISQFQEFLECLFRIWQKFDWIRTTDLWCWKQLLNQLSHNHCPYFSCRLLIKLFLNYLSRWLTRSVLNRGISARRSQMLWFFAN